MGIFFPSLLPCSRICMLGGGGIWVAIADTEWDKELGNPEKEQGYQTRHTIAGGGMGTMFSKSIFYMACPPQNYWPGELYTQISPQRSCQVSCIPAFQHIWTNLRHSRMHRAEQWRAHWRLQAFPKTSTDQKLLNKFLLLTWPIFQGENLFWYARISSFTVPQCCCTAFLYSPAFHFLKLGNYALALPLPHKMIV